MRLRLLRLALVTLTLVALLAASAQACGQHSVPLPPGGWQTVRDSSAVGEAAGGAMGYAYADVSNYRIVTAGPLTHQDRAHEVGHIFDWNVLTDGDRAILRAIMHAPTDSGWWQDGALRHHGAEWFADYYSAVAIGYDPRPQRLKNGGLRGGNIFTYATVTPHRLHNFKLYLKLIERRPGIRAGIIDGPSRGAEIYP